MSFVPLIISWPIETMPIVGVWEVWTHTAAIADLDDVPTTATKINETRGHQTIYAAPPETTLWFFVRFRNDSTEEFSDWSVASFTTGKLALRSVVAPLARTGGEVSLGYNTTDFEVETDLLRIKAVDWSLIVNKPELYTQAEVNTQIANAIAALIDTSPAALDTLNELAAALGDDPNFATTVTNALAGKASTVSGAYTAAETAHTEPADFAAVKAALDALGTRLNELQTKLVIAGIGA